MKELYEMKLHEIIHIEPNIQILRIPGGWIYTILRLDCNIMSSVFVPFHNEFM